METIRKPFQGVTNIIKFNWHFYAIILLILMIFGAFYFYFPGNLKNIIFILGIFFFSPVLISFLVSYYIYDASDLYSLKWLNIQKTTERLKIINIHAGFDETSDLLKKKFPNSDFQILDFFDPKKHTEISIKRARKLYPNSPETISVKTNFLPFENHSVDLVFLIFATHEIRNNEERVIFFNEINRILKDKGTIIVTEHLRDFNNFLAYNIGFFHFLPFKVWTETFENSQFQISEMQKINPFVTTFYLSKYGISS